MRKTWVLALTVALCGCERTERSGVMEAKAPAEAKARAAGASADGRPVIACFGDSLTAGFGLEAGQSFPDLLQQDLDRHGYEYRVVNDGQSGDTSQDGLARLDVVLAEKPAIIVLEFGANDGLRGQPVANSAANLGRMIEAFQKAGARVVLAGITLPPNYGPDYIRRFDAMYPALAAKYKTPLIPFLLAGVGGNASLMQRDGLHPNAEGTRVVAETVEKALVGVLR
jgi:acyl-CoA thioesterase-1